jgi:soluble lytic murein transglycosylase
VRPRTIPTSKAALFAAAFALQAASCGRGDTPTAPPVVASAAPKVADAAPEAAASSSDASAAIGGDWATAVRLDRWEEAQKLLDALPADEKEKPEIKYVRARTALARGEYAAVLPLLTGLETAMPLLADDIARHRAEAKLHVGPFDEAAQFFASRATAWPRHG